MTPKSLLLAALWTLSAAPAQALLYSGSAGYRYTAGDQDYWGHDIWSYGQMRLEGGWYPFAQLSWSQDSYYDWVAAPGAGLARGFAGIGKFRAGYTYYRGRLRDDLDGDAHGVEAGFTRAFTPRLTADAAYRLTTGELFAGVNRQLAVVSGQGAARLGYAVFHQGMPGFSWSLPQSRLIVEGGVAGGAGPDGTRFIFETLSASVPLWRRLFATASVSLAQSNRVNGRSYLGAGLAYSFAGKVRTDD